MLRLTLALAPLLALPGAAAAAVELPAEVARALEGAVTLPDARLAPLSYQPSLPRGCALVTATVARPIESSGRVAVKLGGEGCSGWAWVRVDLLARVAVTTRPVRAGEPLAGAIALLEKAVPPGRAPATIADGAVAARAIGRDQIVEQAHVASAPGPAAGATLKVVIQSGALAVASTGRRIACGGGRVCAVLPSGKHVEGSMVNGTLVVEVP